MPLLGSRTIVSILSAEDASLWVTALSRFGSRLYVTAEAVTYNDPRISRTSRNDPRLATAIVFATTILV
jgi:hypothetical protein